MRKRVDVSGTRNTGARGDRAFRPPTPADQRRAMKERVPARVRELLDIHDRLTRGERVPLRDEWSVSWASPQKIAEQRAKTGDALVPRELIARREREYARTGTARTGIKRTFTGRPVIERGNYRELAGDGPYGLETRVRRSFDWRTSEDVDEF
jgi:hypothetical protein